MCRLQSHSMLADLRARTAPGKPFAVPGVTFPFASAFSMFGSHAQRGVNPAHMISPHGLPIDPSYRGGKGYHRYIKKIKKVGKQFVRAGRGTRPSREGRAEGGVR